MSRLNTICRLYAFLYYVKLVGSELIIILDKSIKPKEPSKSNMRGIPGEERRPWSGRWPFKSCLASTPLCDCPLLKDSPSCGALGGRNTEREYGSAPWAQLLPQALEPQKPRCTHWGLRRGGTRELLCHGPLQNPLGSGSAAYHQVSEPQVSLQLLPFLSKRARIHFKIFIKKYFILLSR